MVRLATLYIDDLENGQYRISGTAVINGHNCTVDYEVAEVLARPLIETALNLGAIVGG